MTHPGCSSWPSGRMSEVTLRVSYSSSWALRSSGREADLTRPECSTMDVAERGPVPPAVETAEASSPLALLPSPKDSSSRSSFSVVRMASSRCSSLTTGDITAVPVTFDGSDRRFEMTICWVFLRARCSRFCVDALWNIWLRGPLRPPGSPEAVFAAPPIGSPPAAAVAPPGGKGGRVARLNSILLCCGDTDGGDWKFRKDFRLLS